MRLSKSHHLAYASAGALLGLGAPAGSLALRLLSASHGNLIHRLLDEWHAASYFYIYMTISTTLAFTIFGYYLGHKTDRLEVEKKRVDQLAVKDGLTHLYNHRYLLSHMAAEVERSKRYGSAFACLMLDIDDFKAVNDRYGHLVGDHVLRVIGHIVREQVRRVDTPGRYGGEEFAVIMPHTTINDVLPVAERIRQEVQEFPFHSDGEDVHVTLSIGVALFEPAKKKFRDRNDVLKAADVALYRAKKAGKNRTVVYSAAD
jgi:diguanylate cyclase (GGDEF)-like protein